MLGRRKANALGNMTPCNSEIFETVHQNQIKEWSIDIYKSTATFLKQSLGSWFNAIICSVHIVSFGVHQRQVTWTVDSLNVCENGCLINYTSIILIIAHYLKCIYICVCVCVCACARACVCVCVLLFRELYQIVAQIKCCWQNSHHPS
jgi:hypothetical protein